MRSYTLCWILFFGLPFLSFAQASSFREYKRNASTQRITLDTLSIYPNSFAVSCRDQKLDRNQYVLDYSSAQFQLIEGCSDSITFRYRVIPMNFSKIYKSRDTSVLYVENKGDREKFLLPANENYTDI